MRYNKKNQSFTTISGIQFSIQKHIIIVNFNNVTMKCCITFNLSNYFWQILHHSRHTVLMDGDLSELFSPK